MFFEFLYIFYLNKYIKNWLTNSIQTDWSWFELVQLAQNNWIDLDDFDYHPIRSVRLRKKIQIDPNQSLNTPRLNQWFYLNKFKLSIKYLTTL